MRKSLTHFTENEFNRLFLKNYFRELITSNGITYTKDELENMSLILADLFTRRFACDVTPSDIMSRSKDVEEWLDQAIEELKL